MAASIHFSIRGDSRALRLRITRTNSSHKAGKRETSRKPICGKAGGERPRDQPRDRNDSRLDLADPREPADLNALRMVLVLLPAIVLIAGVIMAGTSVMT
jgi:hypothetical protein